MIESQYSVFYNYFGQFRYHPLDGLLLRNSKNGDWTNGSLPFFVWYSIQEIKQKIKLIMNK